MPWIQTVHDRVVLEVLEDVFVAVDFVMQALFIVRCEKSKDVLMKQASLLLKIQGTKRFLLHLFQRL